MKTTILNVLLIIFFNTLFGQEFQWANGYGAHTSDNSASTAIDQNGDLLLTGYATAGTMIGDYQIQNRGMYVAKINSFGELIWAMESDGEFSTQSTGIACDYSNSVIITGYYSHTISFGDIELPYAIQPRMFLVKYDSAGNVKWAKSYGSVSITNRTYTNSIVVDNAGNIYTTGAFNRLVVFGDITLESKDSESFNRFDIFLAKFNQDGNTIWAKRAGGKYDDYAYCITYNKENNIYISGVFHPKQADFGEIYLDIENTRARDFVSKLDTAGNTLWVKNGDVGYDGFSETTSMATDTKGNLYAYGNYSGSLIYGVDTLNATNCSNYILKLDSAGNKVFINALYTGSCASATTEGTWGHKKGDFVTDINNNLFLTANFHDTLTIEQDTLISYQNIYNWASSDIFVVKYNEIGFPQWAISAGGTLTDYANAIVNKSSDLYVSGFYSSLEATFGDYVITNNSGNQDYDFYLSKIIDTAQNQCPDINATLFSSYDYICEGDSVLLTCESNYGSSFQWVINDSLFSFQYSNNYWANDSVKVYVIVNPNSICSDASNTIYIEKRQKPTAEILNFANSIICPDSSINLTAYSDPGYNYFWFRNEQLIDSVSDNINVSLEGNYCLKVFKNGCQNSDTIQISSKEIPIIELSLDTLVTYTFPVNYNAGPSSDQYIWKFEDDTSSISNEQTVEFTQKGMYHVFLTNECGSDNDSILVYNPLNSISGDEDCKYGFKVYPNPANNEISILSRYNTDSFEVTIYNHLGEKVLHQMKYSGKIDISKLVQGVYIIEMASFELNIRQKLIIEQ